MSKPMKSNFSNLPLKVSLLVAVRNEEYYIDNCIRSIICQDYPSDFLEVIIADGKSNDNTVSVLYSLIADYPNIYLIDNENLIQSAGWNQALDLCHGEIISIVSGHVILSPDYVSKAVETLKRTGAALVGGTVRSISSGKVGEAISLAMSHPFGVGGARFRYTEKEEETDSVFMGFCLRQIYEKIGKYDEELVRNQDDEFSYRLKKAGGRIICNPEIRSFYNTRSTYKSLWQQYFQYGLWKVRVLQKHPNQMRLRQFVPLAFVLSVIFTLSLTFFFSWGWVTLLGLLGAYLLANLTASILASKNKSLNRISLLSLAFATIHLSYGLGFLIGFFKFWNRWGDKLGKVPPLSPLPIQRTPTSQRCVGNV